MVRRRALRLALTAIAIFFFIVGDISFRLCEAFRSVALGVTGAVIVLLAIFILVVVLLSLLSEHHGEQGLKLFFRHWIMTIKLEKQLVDAGFGVQQGRWIELPKIHLLLSKDMVSGRLSISNSVRLDSRLDSVLMSAALGRYVVDYHYLTDDGNEYIYELVDGNLSHKQTFDSSSAFLEHSKTISPYMLFLDGRSVVKLQHALLVGMTGSGKTYALYSLVLQMLNKTVPYNIYFADPKNSSLAIVGTAIAEEKTAVDVSSIISLLESFVSKMQQRKEELKELLQSRLDADYSDFGLSPMVFICDEYATFASVLASEDKATRDRVRGMLYQIILQGRQLGCFLVLVMQKSDAHLIDTALRENLSLKIVLGQSESQTYVTAFGAGVTIPNRHYAIGEGVFTEPEIAPEPKLVQLPHLNFDILQSAKAPVA